MTDDPTEHDAHPDAVAEPPVASSSAATPAKDAPAPARRLRELLALAAVIFGFDLLTKVLAVHYIDPADPVSIVGDTVTLTLVRNPGAAFSMATGMTWLLTLVAVAVGWWPVFNVADSAIVCGAILLVALTVFGFEPDGTRSGRKHTSEETA